MINQYFPDYILIKTDKSVLKISEIKEGDKVDSPFGLGLVGHEEVLKIDKLEYDSTIVCLKLENGANIDFIPECPIFVRKNEAPWMVYVMYKKNMGFRVGVTKGNSDQRKLGSNSKSRLAHEAADKMWIIYNCESRNQAQFLEQKISVTYGFPTWVFTDRQSGGNSYQQQDIDKLFKEVDTYKSFERLAQDFSLVFNYPHYQPQATTLGAGRTKVNLRYFNDNRYTSNKSSSLHRISIDTGNLEAVELISANGLKIRKGKAKTLRHVSYSKDFKKILMRAKELEKHGMIIEETADLLGDGYFQLVINSGSVLPGWSVFIKNSEEKLEAIRVVKKEFKTYKGFVYGLTIKNTACYLPNNVVVSN